MLPGGGVEGGGLERSAVTALHPCPPALQPDELVELRGTAALDKLEGRVQHPADAPTRVPELFEGITLPFVEANPAVAKASTHDHSQGHFRSWHLQTRLSKARRVPARGSCSAAASGRVCLRLPPVTLCFLLLPGFAWGSGIAN